MHSCNLIISYKRFESIWQLTVIYAKKIKHQIVLCSVCLSIHLLFCKIRKHKTIYSFICSMTKILKSVCCNKLLLVTTLFPDLLVINWYMYAVRYIGYDEAFAICAKISRMRKQFIAFVCQCLYLYWPTRTSN